MNDNRLPLPRHPILPSIQERVPRLSIWVTVVSAGTLLYAQPAHTQETLQKQAETVSLTPPDTPVPLTDEDIGFAADKLDYNSDTQMVTASGNVQLLRQGNRLRADTVVWNRSTGTVKANGNVSVTDPDGNIGYGDAIDITDSLKDGIVSNMLLVMEQGGRLAAANSKRVDNVYTLDHAAYTPCTVEATDGCPKDPSWQIKAVRVVYRPDRERVYYRNARLEVFGLPILALPTFSHPVGNNGGTGFLLPDFRVNGTNGLELALPFYLKMAPNRDLTITPHVYSSVLPMLEASYRSLTSKGAYRITGFATYGSRVDQTTTGAIPQKDLRGYFEASGRFQLDPHWSIAGSLRRATDRTFLRRYSLNGDDRLRSTVNAERIDAVSYLSIAGWSIQSMRLSDVSGQMPIAFPAIDYRLRLANPILGGKVQFQANSLAIMRTAGEDSQRAFALAEWNLRRLTRWGQELKLTGFARGDIYHSSDNLLTAVADYRGISGWQTRGIVAAAADARWPFVGSFFGGIQRITPHVQIVASPRLANLNVPNEDSRSVDLEDSNLFALNRFSGYDRFEDSSRISYGIEYALDLNDFTLESVVGQSYRLTRRSSILPDGTGLSDRQSDIVGRTTIRYRDFVRLTHRYRLDKSQFAVRRNEIDAEIGSHATYATISYLRFNRNITTRLEDLADREEVRLGGRVQFAHYWSLFGSTIIDLTGKSEDPFATGDGFSPVRQRVGVAYQDNCLDLSVTWRREYHQFGDARPTSTFQLRLAFRNLGI